VSLSSVALVDIDALRHNYNRVKQLAPQSKVMSMVKANAYGHGLVNIAKVLNESDELGVARPKEATFLRKAGIQSSIILMEGVLSEDELALCESLNLGLVIHSDYQIEMLEHNQHIKIPYVWIKINTGMNRLGFPYEKMSQVYQQIKSLRHIQEIRGVMTHFAAADETHHDFTAKQIQCFNAVTRAIPLKKSMANSAGIMAWDDSHVDWVRPGLMLYGVSPFRDKIGADLGLKPVMHLTAKLIAINHCYKGDKVGYGGIFVCPKDMPIGVVSIGYGDGYPRYIREKMPVLVNGIETKVIGLVSMDMLTVDLSPIKNAQIGDSVTLWGTDLPVERIAKAAHTSVYELLAGLTSRIQYQNIN